MSEKKRSTKARISSELITELGVTPYLRIIARVEGDDLPEVWFMVWYETDSFKLKMTLSSPDGAPIHYSSPIRIKQILDDEPKDIEYVKGMMRDRMSTISAYIKRFLRDLYKCEEVDYVALYNTTEEKFIFGVMDFARGCKGEV